MPTIGLPQGPCSLTVLLAEIKVRNYASENLSLASCIDESEIIHGKVRGRRTAPLAVRIAWNATPQTAAFVLLREERAGFHCRRGF
jgi:hypothetical protein